MVTDHTLYCKAIALAIWHICPNLAASPDHCSFPSKSIREIGVQKKLKLKIFWMGAIHFSFLFFFFKCPLAFLKPQTDKERLLFCQEEQESRSWNIQASLSRHNVPVETCNSLLPLACLSVRLSPLPSSCMSVPGDRVPERGGGGAAHHSVHHSLQSDGAGGEGSHRWDPSAGVSVHYPHHFFHFFLVTPHQSTAFTFGDNQPLF